MKKYLVILMAGLLMFLTAGPAQAIDDAAPVVSEFTMTPSSLDSSSNTRQVSFSFRVTDVTGVANVTLNFCSYFGTVFASDSGIASNAQFYAPGPRALPGTITGTGNRNDLRIVITINLLTDALPETCEVTTYSSDTRANGSGNISTGNTLTIRRTGITPSPLPTPTVSASPQSTQSPRPSASPSPSATPSPSASPSIPTPLPIESLPQNSVPANYFWSGSTLTVKITKSSAKTRLIVSISGKPLDQRTIAAFGTTATWKNVGVGDIKVTQIRANRSQASFQKVAKKYLTCDALTRVFAGGVAVSSKSKNSGKAQTKKSTLSASVYLANQHLDKDNDGLSCEK